MGSGSPAGGNIDASPEARIERMRRTWRSRCAVAVVGVMAVGGVVGCTDDDATQAGAGDGPPPQCAGAAADPAAADAGTVGRAVAEVPLGADVVLLGTYRSESAATPGTAEVVVRLCGWPSASEELDALAASMADAASEAPDALPSVTLPNGSVVEAPAPVSIVRVSLWVPDGDGVTQHRFVTHDLSA